MNGDPVPGTTDPQVRLAEVVAEASRPEPPRWVQGWQMVLAFLVMAAAFGLAFLLVAEGPPAPKAPEGSAETTQEASSSPVPVDPKKENASVPLLTAEGDPSQEPRESTPPQSGEGGEESDDDSTEPSDSTGEEEPDEESDESIASLSEQGPWAFAIIALLIGAFLATGKTLNFGGTTKSERRTE